MDVVGVAALMAAGYCCRPAANGDNQQVSGDKLFRIGEGYVDYWIHETTHWSLEPRQQVAARDWEESLRRLVRQRDLVQDARRAYFNASSFERWPISQKTMHRMFDATHDFYLTFYAALSAFASFLTRFGEAFGNVPSRSNSQFIAWIGKNGFFPEVVAPVLEEARRFRTLIDHKASEQPFSWDTADVEGLPRVVLHGPVNQNGRIPDGAIPSVDDPAFSPEHDWFFVAPDEDLVLSALAIQMNKLFPQIQWKKLDKAKAASCDWAEPVRDEGPAGGYPILAAFEGEVVFAGPSAPTISEQDQAAINEILAKYIAADDPDVAPDPT